MKIFENLSKIPKNLCFSFQTREKLTQGFLNFFEKYAKIMHFLQFSSEFFFENFRKFSGVRGAPPPEPPTRPAKTLNPSEIFFLRRPLNRFKQSWRSYSFDCHFLKSIQFIWNFVHLPVSRQDLKEENGCLVAKYFIHRFFLDGRLEFESRSHSESSECSSE